MHRARYTSAVNIFYGVRQSHTMSDGPDFSHWIELDMATTTTMERDMVLTRIVFTLDDWFIHETSSRISTTCRSLCVLIKNHHNSPQTSTTIIGTPHPTHNSRLPFLFSLSFDPRLLDLPPPSSSSFSSLSAFFPLARPSSSVSGKPFSNCNCGRLT